MEGEVTDLAFTNWMKEQKSASTNKAPKRDMAAEKIAEVLKATIIKEDTFEDLWAHHQASQAYGCQRADRN